MIKRIVTLLAGMLAVLAFTATPANAHPASFGQIAVYQLPTFGLAGVEAHTTVFPSSCSNVPLGGQNATQVHNLSGFDPGGTPNTGKAVTVAFYADMDTCVADGVPTAIAPSGTTVVFAPSTTWKVTSIG